jgi:hypothetical protein
MNENDIIIEASAPGLGSAQLRVPTSKDPKASALSVAANGAGKPVSLFSQSRGEFHIPSPRIENKFAEKTW